MLLLFGSVEVPFTSKSLIAIDLPVCVGVKLASLAFAVAERLLEVVLGLAPQGVLSPSSRCIRSVVRSKGSLELRDQLDSHVKVTPEQHSCRRDSVKNHLCRVIRDDSDAMSGDIKSAISLPLNHSSSTKVERNGWSF